MLDPIRDWDDAFANMAHIPGSDRLPDQWTQAAAAYRASGVRIDQGIAYGDAAPARLDLIWPDGPPLGLAVFVHGGYWMQTDRQTWTHLAAGAVARGWAVCLPGYTLAPDISIAGITQQIGAAIACAAGMVAGPLRLAGHSAGGHLVTRMICDDTPLPRAVLDRIAGVVSISGVHDLRALCHTRMNATLKLDQLTAQAESPVLHRPARTVPLTCWVGGGERPEFIRQSRLLAAIWDGLDLPTDCILDGNHDHFSVLDGLCTPDSALVRRWLTDDTAPTDTRKDTA